MKAVIKTRKHILLTDIYEEASTELSNDFVTLNDNFVILNDNQVQLKDDLIIENVKEYQRS